MATTDPYQLLNVKKSASQDEIKDAYRKLAKKLHPDLNPGNKEAEKKFKEINQAYELIGTPDMRSKFDQGAIDSSGNANPFGGAGSRARGAGGAPPFYYETQQDGGRYSESFGSKGESGFDEDLFSSIFGAGARRSQNARTDLPGEDQLYRMMVNFKEAALGGAREISLPNGKKLSVKIPAGVASGSKLRFKGQGGQSRGSAPPGDAYVEIEVTPSALYKRNGKDLEIELPISFSEALLGGEVKVPTLNGPVMLKVPAGVSSGTRLRVKGRGVGSGDQRGDQFVALKIVMPSQVDDELKNAVLNWSVRHPDNPRESFDGESS